MLCQLHSRNKFESIKLLKWAFSLFDQLVLWVYDRFLRDVGTPLWQSILETLAYTTALSIQQTPLGQSFPPEVLQQLLENDCEEGSFPSSKTDSSESFDSTLEGMKKRLNLKVALTICILNHIKTSSFEPDG